MVQNISELTIFNDAETTKIRLLPGEVGNGCNAYSGKQKDIGSLRFEDKI